MYYCCVKDESIECLPDIVPCEDLNDSASYFNKLYTAIFVPTFISTHPVFNGKNVIIRNEPRFFNWEHGFLHVTHKKYNPSATDINDRDPDFRRSERITWVRPIIENYNSANCLGCDELFYWEEIVSGYIRPHIMVMDDEYDAAFLVVLEKRSNHYMLITSFYLEKQWEIDKRLKKYERYKKQKTPIA